MSIAVIGAGLGRTGTYSLKLALEILGFGKCCHMFELVEHADRVPYWVQAALNENLPWDKALEGFGATVDWPGASFYRQLADHYPGAKVILTIRDSDEWYRSTQATIAPIVTQMARGTSPHAMMMRHIVLRMFDGDFQSREHCIAVFNRHNEEVRHNIPPERLLVYRVTEGWVPLCKFLNKEVPTQAFPATNNQDEFHQIASDRLDKLKRLLDGNL
jgi:hypothetical protein